MGQPNPKDSSRLRGDARARREQRQREASERKDRYVSLSIEERLAKLDARPGTSARERAKLERALVEQKAKVLKSKVDKKR